MLSAKERRQSFVYLPRVCSAVRDCTFSSFAMVSFRSLRSGPVFTSSEITLSSYGQQNSFLGKSSPDPLLHGKSSFRRKRAFLSTEEFQSLGRSGEPCTTAELLPPQNPILGKSSFLGKSSHRLSLDHLSRKKGRNGVSRKSVGRPKQKTKE